MTGRERQLSLKESVNSARERRIDVLSGTPLFGKLLYDAASKASAPQLIPANLTFCPWSSAS